MKHETNDVIAITSYAKITGVRSGTVSVADLITGQTYDIHGKELHDRLQSADKFETEEKVTKTEIAQKLCESFNIPFTVVFTKQDGSERVLRGKLESPEPLMGRSHVTDLDCTEDHKLRLVDHRTIKSLTVGGVKYVVKGK